MGAGNPPLGGPWVSIHGTLSHTPQGLLTPSCKISAGRAHLPSWWLCHLQAWQPLLPAFPPLGASVSPWAQDPVPCHPSSCWGLLASIRVLVSPSLTDLCIPVSAHACASVHFPPCHKCMHFPPCHTCMHLHASSLPPPPQCWHLGPVPAPSCCLTDKAQLWAAAPQQARLQASVRGWTRDRNAAKALVCGEEEGQRARTSGRGHPGPGRESLIFKAQACGRLILNVLWLHPQPPISLLFAFFFQIVPSTTPTSTCLDS